MAFEVTVDDVFTVLNNHNVILTTEQIEQIFDDIIAPSAGAIESAAMCGNDLDEQTDFAHNEIALLLKDNGFIS